MRDDRSTKGNRERNKRTQQKGGQGARRSSESMIGLIVSICLIVLRALCRTPGQSETPPGLRRLLLFGFLCLLRLLRLLRFLSHSILSGFNGLKRDTRDARRRASLAKSSRLIPADSEAAAPNVTPLSRRYPQMLCILMCFFGNYQQPRTTRARFSKTPNVRCAQARRPGGPSHGPWRSKDAAGTGACAIFINSKPQRGFRRGVESPLSEQADRARKTTGHWQ
jgi:hypothetical protein